MKNNNLPFNPAEVVDVVVTLRKFVVFGKPVAEYRRYYDGRWKYISPKKYAEQAANAQRAAEDAALTSAVTQTVTSSTRQSVINAALRIDPGLKKKAQKLRVVSTEEIATLTGEAKVLAVKIDEAQKAKEAAELLLQE